MRFIQINDLTIHYNIAGTADNPALVFINSLGCDLRIWDEVAPRFVDRFFVIRYDKRGHGLSDCPPGPYTIGELADELAGLLMYLGVETAVPIGISVGGMIALDFAARYPNQVNKLVLSDTGAVIGAAPYWAERIAALEAGGLTEMGETILGRWFAPGFAAAHPAAYQGYFNMLSRTPLAGYIATCAAIRDADLGHAAASITAPTLVLCGAEDTATPPELGKELAEMVGDGRFRLIADAGHLPCIEQPEAMVEVIQKFIN